ncbi:hypothetical protein [Pseudomonas syringae]|uniref:hypothetical protein n=1 Tax=Pseudomonas syringae TaxID=317 RepID=UPI001F0ED33D|nr:hypothetical protein [Pseudomonas syringae]MCH5556840.1 hypothetical protein [Pseudomonas syringae pv. syringae]MCH5577137.1 hypothetical protein [Pseudomonas syringae pv. syringae]MCH5669216.1 hypothetical protein [Pseudomonas syringae pv. syringae]
MSLEFTPGVGFLWTTQSGDIITIEYPFSEPDSRIPSEDVVVYLLWAAEHKESEVSRVYIDGKNNGWFFTVSAMLSADNSEPLPFFRTATWAVISHLIMTKSEQIENICSARGELICSITDFISDDLSILTLHKPRLPERLVNSPYLIVPQLLSQGIFVYVDERTKLLTHPPFVSPGGRYNLSSEIALEEFGEFQVDLLVNHIPYVDSDVFKFYLYYQIIESLMELVAVAVCQDTLSKIAASNGDPTQSYDILAKHKDRSTEKYRISQVFNQFLSTALGSAEILRRECIEFELSADPSASRDKLESRKNLSSHIYAVRNQIIHNFRRVRTSTGHLENVVKALDLVVPDLLCKFRKVTQIGAETTEDM